MIKQDSYEKVTKELEGFVTVWFSTVVGAFAPVTTIKIVFSLSPFAAMGLYLLCGEKGIMLCVPSLHDPILKFYLFVTQFLLITIEKKYY